MKQEIFGRTIAGKFEEDYPTHRAKGIFIYSGR